MLCVWQRKQWYDGPFNPSSTPPDADSLPLQVGGSFSAGRVPAGRVRGHVSITDGIGGSLEETACLPGVEGRL